jgi:hypothetical protein
MKKIILIVIMLISLNSYAQNQYGSRLNNLEDAVVFYVNEYRASLRLNTLRRTKKYEDACDNQSQYLVAVNYNRFHNDTTIYKAEKNKTINSKDSGPKVWISHNQEIDLPNWIEKPLGHDRYRSLWGFDMGECISILSHGSTSLNKNTYIDSIEQTAVMIVNNWKKSHKHNEILKLKNADEVSIAIRYIETSRKIKLDLPDIGIIGQTEKYNFVVSTISVYSDKKNGAK